MTERSIHLEGIGERQRKRSLGHRSLSYNGCWTCRKRRTKCDERPVACQKCESANIACAGYGIRLHWNTGSKRNVSESAGSRRKIKPDMNVSNPLTEDEVVRSLSMLDRLTDESSSCAGPFSVFSLLQSKPAQASSHLNTANADSTQSWYFSKADVLENVPNEDGSDIAYKFGTRRWLNATDENFKPTGIPSEGNTDASSAEEAAMEYSSCEILDDNEDSPIDFPGHDSESPEYLVGRAVDANECGYIVGADEQPMSIVPPASTHNFDTTSSGPDGYQLSNIRPQSEFQQQVSRRDAQTTQPSFANMSLGSPLQYRLIHHYLQHMVHLMQPVLHRDNPFRTLYFPLAVEGSSELELAQDTDLISSAGVATFHSLSSLAAINLRSLGSEEESLEQLAFRHKQRALVALRYALTRKTSSYKSLMIAMLSLVSADVIDGGVGDHWIHVEAATRLQASRHHSPLVSRETRRLNAQCTMMRLFAHTALLNPDPSPWTEDAHVMRDYSEPCIEYLYGITTVLASSIDNIYRLTQHLAYYKDKIYPAGLMDACEALGDQLCSWTISSESFSTIEVDQPYTLQIAHAQGKAFHYSSLIYYYRSVQGCSRKWLHQEQRACLDAMNEAEDVKFSFLERDTQPAPISWPAFIASCEAEGEYREAWDKWWHRVEVYRLKNYSKQRSLVHRIWKELDKSKVALDWRDVLAAMNLRVLPV